MRLPPALGRCGRGRAVASAPSGRESDKQREKCRYERDKQAAHPCAHFLPGAGALQRVMKNALAGDLD